MNDQFYNDGPDPTDLYIHDNNQKTSAEFIQPNIAKGIGIEIKPDVVEELDIEMKREFHL